MTFLNPLVLLALAAASIPLLLHLLNLRKLRTVDFSSLRFLKELQKTRIRRLKLKQILLMLLRMALVIFAVLAFARPAFTGTAGLPGAHASTTAVILFDNSFSMGARDARGTRMDQARRAAMDVVGLLESNDEAMLIPMTELKQSVGAEATRNSGALRATITNLRLGYQRADLNDALRIAASILDKSENINKELYVITDAQRTNVRAVADSLRLFDASTRIYLLPVGTSPIPANLGLDSVKVLTSVIEPGKPVEVRAWIHNYGEKRSDNVVASLNISGQRLAQATISVDPGKNQTLDLSAAPRIAGMAGGFVEITGDEFDADNRRYFALHAAGQMKVALIGSGDDTRFLQAAFALSPALISAEQFAGGSLAAVDLSRFSSVILSNPPALSSGDADKLERYLEDGGGVVIYGGPSVSPATFNSGAATLGLLVGQPIDAPSHEKPLVFTAVNREHPIFSGVFDPANPGNRVESPSMFRIVPATGGDPIIRLSNGQPFMSELRRGRGHLIYIAVPPNLAWSDLPRHGIFVPIALRSALYAGSTSESFVQATVGEEITVPIPILGNVPDQVKVTTPGGSDEFVPVRKLPSGASIQFAHAFEPGIYRITANGSDVALFVANPGVGESDLTPMNNDQLRSAVEPHMTTPKNLKILSNRSADYKGAITESRFGLELWKYALVLAILCAFAEMFLGRGRGSVAAAA